VKRETGGSSETLLNWYQTTRCQYAEEQNPTRNVVVWLRVSGQQCVVAVQDAFVFGTPWEWKRLLTGLLCECD
jgi:hypothetical protein